MSQNNLQKSILEQKYFIGKESSWGDLCERVSNAIGFTKQAKQDYFDLMYGKRMLPGGRILFGAGNSQYNNTIYNCFYLDIMEDSLDGIFEWCKQAARTYSLGGGMGVTLETMRPEGTPVSNTAMTSSGGVSFANLFSETTGTISQKGRRGALMQTISVDYPDIEQFITIKNDEGRRNVRFANISVKLTDEFMVAVKNDTDFMLKWNNKEYRSVNARKIFRLISQNAHSSAEPGVLYWDTIERYSPSQYCAPVRGTNPCSEIPLESGGGCLLTSINITKYIKNRKLDTSNLEKDIRTAIRFLDDCISYSLNENKFALVKQKKQAKKTRRIGLSFTGLGDAMIKCGIKYGSEESIKFVGDAMKILRDNSYRASIELAKERGSFDLFDVNKHKVKDMFPEDSDIPFDIIEGLEHYGLRNVVCNTIPPAGTISSLADVSSGVEPVYSFVHTRRSESMGNREFKVFHPLVQEYYETHGTDITLPDYFISAYDIPYKKRIDVQSEAQKYVDQAISSTINLPKEATVEDVEDAYMYGWEKGLKGISVYRDGSREGILTSDTENCFRCKKNGVIQESGCKRCIYCGNSSCEL